MTTSSETDAAAATPSRWAKPPLGPRTLTILFVSASLIGAAFALIKPLLGHGHGFGDYATWYAIGQRVLTGGDIYSTEPDGALAFLYPPVAALVLAPFCLLGVEMLVLFLVLANIASWWVAIKLSERLSGVDGEKAWWVIALPSALWLAYIIEIFQLGQPNLLLLAIMLAGLALLQSRRGWSAGTMFAAAAALKAFPVAILPYLLWRRRWAAAASMVLCSIVFLVLVPAPFRGFQRNLQDLKTWSHGMVFSTSEKGFGQRPDQNWSWKNQSLIAVTHRYLRPLNAEAEDPHAAPIYVNLLNLSYDQANLVLAVIVGLIGVGFVVTLPPERRRTPASDGAEFALLITLMTIASPLARGYYFVWLLFPLTVLIDRAVGDPDPRARRLTWRLIVISLVLFSVGNNLVTIRWPQALGNSLWASAVMMGALIWHMRRAAKPATLA
jgi:hypothetical protein